MSKAVYTFIFGDYDDLKPPTIVTPGWDYICFTDDPTLSSEIWDVRLPRNLSDRELDQKRFAMKHLILFHQYLSEYSVSLSIGAQVELNCNLDDLIREHFRAADDMMICYWEQDCIYAEAEGCQRRLTDDPARIEAHMQRYRAAGYPANNGLYMSGIIARRHDRANVRAMCDLWWDEYCHGSRRDQLSLSYAIWKSDALNISRLDYREQFFVRRNFISHPHKRGINFGESRIKFKRQRYPRISRPASQRKSFAGCIDVANCRTIYGWAADRHRLNRSIYVSLYDHETLISTAPADLMRSDIAAYLRDNGKHGFAIPVPASLKDGASHEISIRFEDTNLDLHVNRGLVPGRAKRTKGQAARKYWGRLLNSIGSDYGDSSQMQ